MPFGAEVCDDGVYFRLFGPAADAVKLALDADRVVLDMERSSDGWHTVRTSDAGAGTLYQFVLPDGARVADPASRSQPQGAQGPSEVVDPERFVWSDASWLGRPWIETVFYELHVGTFTPEGTFRAAIAKLDALVELGVTAVELMGIAQFEGRWSWGYDPVLIFAPESQYGTPDDLKALVDAAHTRGLMIIFDVIYNHFGPVGNFISRYFPQMCSTRHNTPWGAALNFDDDGSGEVRAFIFHNALYWIEEFHADGLRMDATHTLIDTSPKHILDELRERVLELHLERAVHLVVEHEKNIAPKVGRNQAGEIVQFAAQWNYDIPRLQTCVFGDFCAPGLENVTRQAELAVAEGFVVDLHEQHQRPEYMAPPTSFVSFIQTHDLVGNRILGDRLSQNASGEKLRALSALYLLMPQIPLIFMGEEWNATTPFPYFCDYPGETGENIRAQRREGFKQIIPEPTEAEKDRAPDPQAKSTFESARLDWNELKKRDHAEWRERYRRLLEVRREVVVPLLENLHGCCGSIDDMRPGMIAVTWTLKDGARLQVVANLCAEVRRDVPETIGNVFWSEGEIASDGTLAPWAVRWSLHKA